LFNVFISDFIEQAESINNYIWRTMCLGGKVWLKNVNHQKFLGEKIMKLVKKIVLVAGLILPSLTNALPITKTDVLFIVDESASMSTEHAWISGMAASLETALIAAGVTDNRYGLVGYVENTGAHGPGSAGPHKHSLNGADWGTAANLAGSLSPALTTAGSVLEDGYEAISFGLNNYTFRADAALNVILITDEDRDNTNASTTFASVLAELASKNALLNAVINNPFKTASNVAALGVDSDYNAYVANGTGGFTVSAGGIVGNGAGTTETDYVPLALQTGGAAWDLNKLRAGGNTATSFTAAFVDIKVQEIINQDPTGVPAPATLVLFGLGVLGLVRRSFI
jgi:hypothetical protein